MIVNKPLLAITGELEHFRPRKYLGVADHGAVARQHFFGQLRIDCVGVHRLHLVAFGGQEVIAQPLPDFGRRFREDGLSEGDPVVRSLDLGVELSLEHVEIETKRLVRRAVDLAGKANHAAGTARIPAYPEGGKELLFRKQRVVKGEAGAGFLCGEPMSSGTWSSDAKRCKFHQEKRKHTCGGLRSIFYSLKQTAYGHGRSWRTG